MIPIEITKQPNTSRLVSDFIAGDGLFFSRFPLNEKLFTEKEIFLQHAEKFSFRVELQDLIRRSMQSAQHSFEQKNNFEILSQKNSLCVVTGQQIGFLGGPLYTLLKIASTISLAKKLSTAHEGLNVIPVFWLEDNDHDAREAAEIFLSDSDYEIRRITAPSDRPVHAKYSTGEISFTDEIQIILSDVEKILPSTIYTANIMTWLRSLYQPGRTWADAFYEFINDCFSSSGLLILRASEVRRMKLFAPWIKEEIFSPGKTKSAVEAGIEELRSAGYHIQAEASEVNAFYHLGGQRIKISFDPASKNYSLDERIFSEKEFFDLFESEPENFSPNVILRPIIQDQILPNAAYVGGPGELAYLSEIREAYQRFGAWQPGFVLRHSATFLDEKSEKFISRKNLPVEFFFRQWSEIEEKILPEVLNPELEELLDKTRKNFSLELDRIRESAVSIDKTMYGAVEAKRTQMEKLFDKMRKKIISAQKRKSTDVYLRYRQASQLLFPGSAPQDRIFSPIVFFNLFGKENFLRMLFDVTAKSERAYYTVHPEKAYRVEKK